MADIVKISVLAVVCTVVTALIKQYAPSYSSLAQSAALVAVLTLGMTFIKDALSSALELMNDSALQREYIFLLIKALGIAVTAKFAADACRDSGSSSLAGAGELAAKAAILVLTMPMLKALAAAVSGLLGA